MSLYVDSNMQSLHSQQQQQGPYSTFNQFSEITNQAPRPSKRAAAAAAAPPKDQSVPSAQVVQSVPLPRSSQPQHYSPTMPRSPTRMDSQFPVLSQQYHAAGQQQQQMAPSYPHQQNIFSQPPPSAQQQQRQHSSSAASAPSAEMLATFNTLVGQMQTLMQQWQQCYPSQQLPPLEQQNAVATGNPAEDMMANLMAHVGQLQGQLPRQQQQHYHQPTREESQAPYRSHQQQQQQQAMMYNNEAMSMMAQAGNTQQQQFQQQHFHQPASYSRIHPQQAAFNPAPVQRGPRLSARGAVMENEPAECILTLVEFKRARLKKFVATDFVQPGQYVIVEGDRGLDCGLVVLCCYKHQDGSVSNVSALTDYKTNEVLRFKTEIGRVQRVATSEDVDMLHGEIASIEREALRTCREVAARMNLPMEIIDCEYQFDRKKVSFYFEANVSVDFRELNTELFRLFGIRIWLENINAKVKNVVPEGALSYADKINFTKNGLRPPRRIH